MRRPALVVLILALALAVLTAAPGLAGAASPIPDPRPPQNPHLAKNPHSNIHNDTWMTDTYAIGGPRGRDLRTAFGPLTASICGGLAFDSRGRIVAVCPSLIAPPKLRLIDPDSLDLLAEYVMPDAPAPPGTAPFQNFTGGGYFFLDNRDRVWSATKTNRLFVMKLAENGRSWRKVADYDLTDAVVGDERISSALPDFQGRIWFVTKANGKVGVLNTRTRRIHVFRTGEQIQNSFTIDRDAVYVVSDKRMYRFSAGRDGRPRVDWEVTYENSGIVKPSQVDAGSGTTPTILPGGYVAIADNADPMNVAVYRTAKRLRGARRVVCEEPVFERGASATENSLLGSGRSLIVENNYGYQNPFGPTAGAITEPGFTRVDVNRDGQGCRTVWRNTTERAPSVVPKLSTRTQIVYAYTQDPNPAGGQTWSWVGISARTGRRVFKQAAGEGLEANNNYAGLAIGPDGTAYLSTVAGIRALRDGPG